MSHYQAKLEEARTVILGVLAHDLRTPLNAISLGTQFILRTEPLDPRAAQAAARTLSSVSRMKGLVQDLLDYTLTRLGTGLPIHSQPTDIELIVRGVVEEVEASYPGRNVNFVSSCDPKGVWDQGRISQMMTNLVVNALQHGDVEQSVDVRIEDATNGVRLTVTNRGDAIPEAERSSLFEPLKQMRQPPDKSRVGSSGLGLGLYVVAEIASAHGGSVELASSDENGTVFAVHLPRLPAPG
jgi:signal transduction histidine kinase